MLSKTSNTGFYNLFFNKVLTIRYQVGGWDDEIYFGSEGPDLALRILDIEPNLARQIYSPISIIHHDYVRDEEHFNNKIKAQKKSRERLQKKHYKFEERLLEWEALFMNEKSIPKKQNINENTILELQKIEQKIMKRNQSSINFLLSGAYFLNDSNLVNKLLEKVNGRGIALFGAGNYGQRVLQRLQDKGIVVQNFYDNNREKIGKKINGIPVISPQEKSKKDFIIITTTWADEVWHELTAASFKLNEDFIIMKY